MFKAGHNFIGYLLRLTLIASLTGILMGLNLAILGGAQPFIFAYFHVLSVSDLARASFIASVPFGAIVGAFCAAVLSDKVGRQGALIIIGLIYVVGVLFIVTAHYFHIVEIGLFLMGAAVGLSSVVTPMYLSEIAPYDVRGAIILVFPLAVTVGILLALFAEYFFSLTGDWHSMFWFCLVPAVLLVIGAFSLPQSPRWLMQKGRNIEASTVLQRIQHTAKVQRELSAIRISSTQASSWGAVFQSQIWPLLLLSCLLFAFQQLSGVNTIFYYVSTVFGSVGMGLQSELMLSILVALVNLLGTLMAMWLIDRVGRRRLLLWGMSLIVLSLLFSSMAYRGWFGHYDQIMVLVAILVFMAAYSVSLGGIPYVIMAELFPNNIRHIAIALCCVFNWLFNSIVALGYLYWVDHFGLSTVYLFYAICTAIGIVMVYRYLPETAQVSLERIEQRLLKGKSVRDLGRDL